MRPLPSTQAVGDGAAGIAGPKEWWPSSTQTAVAERFVLRRRSTSAAETRYVSGSTAVLMVGGAPTDEVSLTS